MLCAQYCAIQNQAPALPFLKDSGWLSLVQVLKTNQWSRETAEYQGPDLPLHRQAYIFLKVADQLFYRGRGRGPLPWPSMQEAFCQMNLPFLFQYHERKVRKRLWKQHL